MFLNYGSDVLEVFLVTKPRMTFQGGLFQLPGEQGSHLRCWEGKTARGP